MINLLILLNVFFVSFTDKPTKDAPALSPRAIEQRQKWKIPTDALDYPVSRVYLDSLSKYSDTIHHTSRWFNGATCTMSEEQAAQVAQWSFVTSVEVTRDNSPRGSFYAPRFIPASKAESARKLRQWPSLTTDEQLALYNLHPLHEMGFNGKGIRISMCDGGFQNANTVGFLRQKQELGHYDFTDEGDDLYGDSGMHGTACMSTIFGKTDEFRGAATDAEYYLMRSEEVNHESPKEMDNLVAALEKADSLGSNIVSISLGYALFDNDAWTLDYNTQLDGKTTRVSRAATIAARKGMLVCVAAGNEGNKAWHWISAPADADSILAVGAVGVDSITSGFSSFGPSADGRIKPEVCAVGVSAAYLNPQSEQVAFGNGTSFATPLIAGLAACLWSALPDENAMQIRERIIRSADRYNNPDSDQYGYGIPDAYAAYKGTTAIVETSVSNKPLKYIQGNTLYIVHNGKTYTVFGTSK